MSEATPVEKKVAYWELHYRLKRSRANDWFILAYKSKKSAEANWNVIQKRSDVAESKIIEKYR